MSFTAAESGFVVFLLFVPVIQAQVSWGVTYSSAEICALQGATVTISCSYTYPNSYYTRVSKSFWFIEERYGPVDLKTHWQYSGRVHYSSHNGKSTLRISDLRKSDSAVYKFRFIINQADGKYTGEPGVTLDAAGVQVQVKSSYYGVQLECHSSCFLPGRLYYMWYKNGAIIWEETSSYHSVAFNSSDSYSCAVQGYQSHRSPSVYAPKVSIAMNSSGDIMEGASLSLTCSSDANPVANYTWYKKKQTVLLKGAQLVFSSIQSSDSGEYYCTAENELGRRTSQDVSVNVRYAPKLPSVSLSPSGQIVEGSSVTLSCSSDANPAANYTWYKENQTVLQGPEGVHHFTSISSEDRGIYCCKSENQYGRISSASLFLDVQYAPKLLSVSLSPSGQIVEGSSVNLSCSSDANPAAIYTWYKEREEAPKASGQIFTISDVTPGHSGSYYCEAQNSRGHNSSALLLIIVAGSMTSVAAGSITAVSLVIIIFLCAFLLIRRKTSWKQTTESGQSQVNMDDIPVRTPAEQENDLYYTSVIFSKKQDDALYSNIRTAQLLRHEDEEEEEEVEVEYTVVNIKSTSAATESSGEAVEDPSAVYSKVNKKT